MKLNQLPLGARFEYDGQIFTKTGPLTAAAENGGQRMIPRYATLRPLGEPPPAAAPQTGRQLDEARVLAAFDNFFQTCQRLTDDFSKPRLEAARQTFLAALKS